MRYSELLKHWKGCCEYCYQREYGVPPNDPISAIHAGRDGRAQPKETK
jgi:hypothetical protein